MIGYILGLHNENGKENGSYLFRVKHDLRLWESLGFRVWGLGGSRPVVTYLRRECLALVYPTQEPCRKGSCRKPGIMSQTYVAEWPPKPVTNPVFLIHSLRSPSIPCSIYLRETIQEGTSKCALAFRSPHFAGVVAGAALGASRSRSCVEPYTLNPSTLNPKPLNPKPEVKVHSARSVAKLLASCSHF